MRKIFALAVAGGLLFAAPASADPEHSNNNTSKKLRAAVTVGGILEHQRAFQRIATFTGGNRLSGTQGYDASAQYVADRSEAAGMKVSRQQFDYELDLLADYTPPVLSVTAGGPARAFVPGIAGALFGGHFGSINLVPVGRSHRPGVGGRHRPRPGHRRRQHEPSGGRLHGDAAGRNCPAAVQRDVLAGHRSSSARSSSARARSSSSTSPSRSGSTWRGPRSRPVSATFDTAVALARGVEKGATGLTARVKVDWRPGSPRPRSTCRRDLDGRPEQRDRGRRASRQRRRRPGHQRQRLGLAPRSSRSRAMQKVKPKQQDPLHLVRRGGARPARLRGLRRQPAAGRARQDRRDS